MAGAFLYFAYIYKKLDEDTCYANAYSQEAFPEQSAMVGINVTSRFKCAIRFGFWIAVLNIIRATIQQISIWKNSFRL